MLDAPPPPPPSPHDGPGLSALLFERVPRWFDTTLREVKHALHERPGAKLLLILALVGVLAFHVYPTYIRGPLAGGRRRLDGRAGAAAAAAGL
jgi:hypothetical protein